MAKLIRVLHCSRPGISMQRHIHILGACMDCSTHDLKEDDLALAWDIGKRDSPSSTLASTYSARLKSLDELGPLGPLWPSRAARKHQLRACCGRALGRLPAWNRLLCTADLRHPSPLPRDGRWPADL